MTERLNGKIAVITGSARGLGEAIARRFAAEGAGVYVTDVRDALGSQVAESIRTQGGRADYVSLDVTSERSWAKLIDHAPKALGTPNVLVNNAFTAGLASFEDETLPGWRRTLDTTLDGALLGMRALVPGMREQGGGAIVNIGSIHGGEVALPVMAAYQVAKAGIRALTRHAALACAADGILINVILPGPMDTPVIKDMGIEDAQEERARSLPLGRVAAPAEVAAMAVFLASDEASYATGGVFTVDGGFTAV